MKIGIPKETAPSERRVALTPDAVARLVKAGHEVVVEAGAGIEAGFPDDAYTTAGARTGDPASAGVACRVQKPSPAEVGKLREGTSVVVQGLQALPTARWLGAVVSGFDVRPAVKEQVESLGAKFLAMEERLEGEGAGGYAKELSADQHSRELEFLARSVKDADVVVTTAAIPGKRAPILVTRAAVDGMHPGSVIVDLAAESGGNCELSQAGTQVMHRGVAILGPVNLPATLPQHASQMYARNISSFLGHVAKDGALRLDFTDEITKATCVTHDGKVLLA